MKAFLHTLRGLLIVASALSPLQPAQADPSDEPLMGAGAHFAWAVFNAIKEDLEQKVARPSCSGRTP